MRPRIVLLATGGTIAGTGEPGKDIGYQSGSLPAEKIAGAVPGLSDIAEIKTIQVNIHQEMPQHI